MTATSPDDVIAERVREFRTRRGWSFPRLAEECAKLGAAHLTVASLTNIERGQSGGTRRKRRDVTSSELAVLARALGVAPVLLMLPLGAKAEVELFPGMPVPTWQAFCWWVGKEGPFLGGSPIIGYFRDHDVLVDAALGNRQRGERLTDLRKNMRRAGILPPELPPELADLDEADEELRSDDRRIM